MKTIRATLLGLLFILSFVFLNACTPSPTPIAPVISFTHLTRETKYDTGENIDLTVEITSDKLITDVYFTVQNTPISRKSISADQVNPLVVSEAWTADRAGQAIVEAYAIAQDGSVIGPASVNIEVLPPKNPTQTPTTLATAAAIQSSPTMQTSSPTQTATVPAVDLKLNINVDNDYLFPGDCTILRWKAEDVDAVFLDGEIVDRENAREICPTETTEYVLEGVFGEGKDTASVLVMVEQMLGDDLTGPEVTEQVFVPKLINYGESCADSSSVLTVKITDESDVLLASVFYRVSSRTEIGEWLEVMLDENDAGLYTYTFSAADLEESVETITEGKLEYYVDAMDLLINETQTETGSIQIKPCTVP